MSSSLPLPQHSAVGITDTHAGLEPVRVAVFGSFYRGLHVLQALVQGALAKRVRVVGVATDDPTQPFVSPHKRVWQYPHELHEEMMVRKYAEEVGIDVYQGRVKTSEFYAMYEQSWRPELCVMATFGQRIDRRLHQFPRLGFFNIHPCIEDAWPSKFVGGNPFDALVREGHRHAVLALHHVDDGFDTGALVAYSERIELPDGASVVDLHRLTAPVAATLINRELSKILHQAKIGTYHGPV
jgi:methionyl-tRNA formyltransferase